MTYTVTLTSTGYKQANGIVVSDLVPSGFSGTATASIGTFSMTGGTWNLDIGTGLTATLTFNGYYITSGTKTNTATITS